MRSVRVMPPLILLLLLAFPWACAQDSPPRLDVFLEGGGSFLNGASGQQSVACPVCPPEGPCPALSCVLSPVAVTSSFSKTVRLFTGARLRFTRHDALEASYSFSPNHFLVQEAGQAAVPGYNRMDLLSCNYVRYLCERYVKHRFYSGVGDGGLPGAVEFC